MLHFIISYNAPERATYIHRKENTSRHLIEGEIPLLIVPDGNDANEADLKTMMRMAETSHRGLHFVPLNILSKMLIHRISRNRIYPEISNYRVPNNDSNTLGEWLHDLDGEYVWHSYHPSQGSDLA